MSKKNSTNVVSRLKPVLLFLFLFAATGIAVFALYNDIDEYGIIGDNEPVYAYIEENNYYEYYDSINEVLNEVPYYEEYNLGNYQETHNYYQHYYSQDYDTPPVVAVNIEVNLDGYINVYAPGFAYEQTRHGNASAIRLPAETSRGDIGVNLSPGWYYIIDIPGEWDSEVTYNEETYYQEAYRGEAQYEEAYHQEEYCQEYFFYRGDYTIVWVMPAVVPPIITALSGAPVGVDIPLNAHIVENLAGLRTALTQAHTVIAVRLTHDQDAGAVITIPAGRTVHIFSELPTIEQAFSLTRGSAAGDRHFDVQGTLHLWNVTLTRPLPSHDTTGGGIVVNGSGHLHMHEGSTIRNNRAANGGGINLNSAGSSATINGGRIYGNQAVERGGGINATTAGDGTLTISGGIIGGIPEHIRESFPTATLWADFNPYANRSLSAAEGNIRIGGGVAVGNRNFYMSGGYIIGNRALGLNSSNINPQGGGGLSIRSASTGGRTRVMSGGTIAYNQTHRTAFASGGGGGVMISGQAHFTMTGGTVRNNFSANHGGGVQLHGDVDIFNRFDMTGGRVDYNRAIVAGGGIHVNLQNEAHIGGNAVIHGNFSHGTGGGIRFYRSAGDTARQTTRSTLTINDMATISGNTAMTNGGGISMGGGTATTNLLNFTMNGGRIINNTATTGGGIGIANISGTVGGVATGTARIYGGLIAGNTATTDGGGLHTDLANIPATAIATPRVYIASAVAFAGYVDGIWATNSAGNGIRVDEVLESTYRAIIRPGVVSLEWVGVNPSPTIVVAERRHAFTNYDINIRNWSHIRRVEFEVLGSAEDDSQMTARITQLTRPRGVTGTGALTPPANFPGITSGTYVIVGPPAGGGDTAASVTMIRYEVDFPNSTTTPNDFARVIDWRAGDGIGNTSPPTVLGPVADGPLIGALPTPLSRTLPTAATGGRLVPNPPAPINENIPYRVQSRIEYYREVTIIVETGAVTPTTLTRRVRYNTPVGNPIPSTTALSGWNFGGWFTAPMPSPAPGSWVATDLSATAPAVTVDRHFVARFNAVTDWMRLNAAINDTTLDPRPTHIVIHPAGGAFAADTQVGTTYNLVVSDLNPLPAGPGGFGHVITTVPIAGAPESDPHRIQVDREVTISVVAGAEIYLRMPVPSSTNTPSQIPWGSPVPPTTLNRHFVVTGGNLIFGAPGSGTLRIDGNAAANAEGNRGGVRVNSGIFTMYTGSAISNSRADNGGGVIVDGGSFYMHGGLIEHNQVLGNAADGGGVRLMLGRMYMTGGIIRANIAERNGGGIAVGNNSSSVSPTTFTMSGGTIGGPLVVDGNTSTGWGGGAMLASGTMYLDQGRIENNSTPSNGGGIAVGGGATGEDHPRGASLVMRGGGDKVIRANRANDGGGVFVDHFPAPGISPRLYMEAAATNVAFLYNQATRYGGGIFTADHGNYPNPLTLAPSSTIAAHFQNITLRNVRFEGNTANALAVPPANALLPANALPNITFSSTSPGAEDPPSTHFGRLHPLNNYDINFQNQTELFEFFKTCYALYQQPRNFNLLPGARFRVYRTSSANPGTGVDGLVTNSSIGGENPLWQEMPMIRSESHGGGSAQSVAFNMIPGYIYQLVEYVSPVGFQVPMGQWRIIVDETDPRGFSITNIGGLVIPEFVYVENAPTPGNVRWFVGNMLQIELPLSGGTGTNISLAAIGTGIICIAMALICVKMKRKSARRDAASAIYAR